MALSKIKEESKDKYVAFGKYNKVLGQREDIDELAIIAHESGDESLISHFEELPPLEELKKAKTDAQLKNAPVKPPVKTESVKQVEKTA